MKKIVGTIIFLFPLILGFAFSFGDNSSVGNFFKMNTAMGSGVNFFEAIIKNKEISTVFFGLFFSIFWSLPFWYAGKGTFIAHGLIARVVLIIVSVFVPFLLIAIALIGLGIKS